MGINRRPLVAHCRATTHLQTEVNTHTHTLFKLATCSERHWQSSPSWPSSLSLAPLISVPCFRTRPPPLPLPKPLPLQPTRLTPQQTRRRRRPRKLLHHRRPLLRPPCHRLVMSGCKPTTLMLSSLVPGTQVPESRPTEQSCHSESLRCLSGTLSFTRHPSVAGIQVKDSSLLSVHWLVKQVFSPLLPQPLI